MEKQQERFNELTGILLKEMNPDGYWDGQLSSSALGVAVAIAALHFYDPQKFHDKILNGIQWLNTNVNDDGGFGDTPESISNISTSLLVYAALNLYANKTEGTRKKLTGYLKNESIDVSSNRFQDSILQHYQKDYTFSVPILTMCALCRIPENNAFDKVPQLPFELSLLPRKFYNILNLSVVSYAIPALIAVGITIYKNKRQGAVSRFIRKRAVNKSLRLLQTLMPQSGGFLEAIPLTAFVSLSLIKAGFRNNEVVTHGIQFLNRTQREDGSWPIDVDLSTWVTTLSIKSLGNKLPDILSNEQRQKLSEQLLSIQNKSVHPFNGTSAGGWGWTHFTGSVPDCDDTPGAIIALTKLGNADDNFNEIMNGVDWLIKTQNRDGGFPTFSKGWGKLPFDQSCSDLTGHAFLAISLVMNHEKISVKQKNRLRKVLYKTCKYLARNQNKEGSWLPLWFGNQYIPNHSNPIYGTARVTTYLKNALQYLSSENDLSEKVTKMVALGEKFLTTSRNSDGSWGNNGKGTGTIEETALSLTALLGTDQKQLIEEGFSWLDNYYSEHGLKASPIGLYFASLWYDEKMYPLVTYLELLGKYLEINNTKLVDG